MCTLCKYGGGFQLAFNCIVSEKFPVRCMPHVCTQVGTILM